MTVRSRLWAAAALVSLLSLLTAGVLHLESTPAGLIASYETFGATARTFSAPVASIPAETTVLDTWAGAPPDAFTATWRGVVYVPADGPYTFATRADGESTIFLDGRIILENGWDQPSQTIRQTVRPDSGEHTFNVNYRHNGGPIHFELLWARGDDPLAPIPSWVLHERRLSRTRILLAHWLPSAVAVLEWVAFALLFVAAAASAAPWLWRGGQTLGRWGAPRELAWIIAGSAVLNATGLLWGVNRGWAVLELTPSYLLEALARHFANGWWNAYPPVHFLILSVAVSPVLALNWLGRLDVYETFWAVALVVSRVVTLLMAAGTIVAIYFSAAHVFGRRAGLFASAIFALAAPFIYFAKLANVDVPYVFWFALSLVFYVRLIDGDRMRDYAGLAITAALAIGTKDQAFGLYIAIPVVLLLSKGLNRRMLTAGALSLVAFALLDNVVFNFSGFRDHVDFVIGPGNANFRAFAPTLAGRAELLGTTLWLLKLTWGWPLFLVCLAGVVMAAAAKHTRRAMVWLLATIAAYYLVFINVILYVYDRFTLPMALVLALFGGFALDRWMSVFRGRRVAATVLAAAFVYTFLYSSTVDVLMLRDSRYSVERWLDMQTLLPNDMVASNVLPALPASHERLSVRRRGEHARPPDGAAEVLHPERRLHARAAA